MDNVSLLFKSSNESLPSSYQLHGPNTRFLSFEQGFIAVGATILGLVILFCTCNWILKPYGRHLEDVYPSLRGLGLIGGRVEEEDDDDDFYLDDLVRTRMMTSSAVTQVNENNRLSSNYTPTRSALYRSHRRSCHARSVRARSRSPVTPSGASRTTGSGDRGNATAINFLTGENPHVLPTWRHVYPQPVPNDRPFYSPPPTYGSCQQDEVSNSIVNNNVSGRYRNRRHYDDDFYRTSRSAASTPPPSYESCNFESLPTFVPFSTHQHSIHENRSIPIIKCSGSR